MKFYDFVSSGASLSANEDADKQRAAGQCPAVFFVRGSQREK